MGQTEEDPKRTKAYLKLASEELKDLIRKGWVFRPETGKVIIDFLGKVKLSDEDIQHIVNNNKNSTRFSEENIIFVFVVYKQRK